MKSAVVWLVIVLAFVSAAGAQSQERPLNAEAVVEMRNAGLTDEVIAEAIKGAALVDFDTSADGLIAMKQAGFSDSIILAIAERQARRFPTGMAPAMPRFVVRQAGRELELSPKGVETSFVPTKNKKDTATQIIQYGGLSAGVYAGAGLIGKLATMGALGRGALTGIAGGIVAGVSMMGRRPTAEGFNFEFLRGRSATLALAPGDVELLIPFAPFHDGSYATAEPLLLKLDIADKDGLRIVSSEKLKITGGDKPKQESLGPKQFKTVDALLEKNQDAIIVRAANLEVGEYGLVFRSGNQLLPEAFDFRVASD